MRTKGIGRGKQLIKPKKTAADFAREAELERRKSEELAAEEAPAVEPGRFSGKAWLKHCILHGIGSRILPSVRYCLQRIYSFKSK